MKSADYPEPFRALVRELRRLPGVGPRSAERMALWALEDGERSSALAEALGEARAKVRHCAECGFFSMTEVCDLQMESRIHHFGPEKKGTTDFRILRIILRIHKAPPEYPASKDHLLF